MKLLVCGAARANDSDTETLKVTAAFRKATRKMLLVSAAANKLSEKIPLLRQRWF
jgi:hypothetical protein